MQISDFITVDRVLAHMRSTGKEEALTELGVDQNDWVVIATRRHFEMSVLILHTLQEMGVKQIVALAAGKDEARVLEKLGADRVVFPERDIAQSQARLILNPALRRYTELAQNYSMVEIEAPRAFVGHTLEDLKVRTRYGVLVVAVRNVSNEKDRPYLPEPDLVLKPGDQMLLIGSDDRIHKLTSTQSA